MKRTEKSKANSRQKNIPNSRQKSRANGRQSNQRTATETRRSTRISTIQSKAAANQPGSPEASKNRCRCPAGTGRSDHCSEAATPKVQKIVKDSHDDCQLSSTKTASQSTTKSIWTSSHVQHISGPKTKSRMSSTVKVGATRVSLCRRTQR